MLTGWSAESLESIDPNTWPGVEKGSGKLLREW